MTTVTLPTAPPPPSAPAGAARLLPRPGRYTVAPGRSLAELTAWYGPLPVRRRRVRLAGADLVVPETVPETVPGDKSGDASEKVSADVSDEAEHPEFRLRFDGTDLTAAFASEHAEDVYGRLQLTGDLDFDGLDFPVLLRLRVVERADDRLLVAGTARLPYRLLRRATGFRLPWRLPATRLRLLVAAEFA